MENIDSTPVLDRILKKAANKGHSLMSIDNQKNVFIRPSIPMRGLVADRSVEIHFSIYCP